MSDNNDLIILNLDRPRVLRFGHKALKTLVAMTGTKLEELEIDDFDLDEIEKVFYCGLLSDAREHGETLKLEDMEDLLDMVPSYAELLEKMQLAFNAAFGPTQVDEKN